MKNKHKSLLSVIAITCAVGVPLSLTTAHELPVQALLTAPSNYQFSYRESNTHSSTSRSWAVLNNGGTSFSTLPIYSFLNDGSTSGDQTTFNIHGLQITLHFTNTNPDWDNITTSTYTPTGSYIGSSDGRFKIAIENSSNKDYSIYLDLTTSHQQGWTFYLNDQLYYDGHFATEFLFQTELSFNTFIKLPITSHSTFYIENVGSDYIAFNAFYLQDLGINASYTQGYDDGFSDIDQADGYAVGYQDGLNNNPNLLITAFESLIGMMVNFTFILFTLEMFGVSILSIVGVLFGLLTIVWILKTIRG